MVHVLDDSVEDEEEGRIRFGHLFKSHPSGDPGRDHWFELPGSSNVAEPKGSKQKKSEKEE